MHITSMWVREWDNFGSLVFHVKNKNKMPCNCREDRTMPL